MFKVIDIEKKGDKVTLIADKCDCGCACFSNGQVITVELNPYCFKEVFCEIDGTEDVELCVCDETYPLLTNAGNVFHAGRLVKKHTYVYRLVYGDDGYPKNVEHFEVLNTPKCCQYSPKKGNKSLVVEESPATPTT